MKAPSVAHFKQIPEEKCRRMRWESAVADIVDKSPSLEFTAPARAI
jgi:hypothetical protein